MGRQRGNQYRPGSYYRSDDRSGFTRRAEQTRKEWTGLIVGEDLWEIRQPQDFVRGVPDDQTVNDARPIPPDVFSGPIYAEIVAPAAVGTFTIFLKTVSGLTPGDPIGVMLASGSFFYTHIAGINPVTTSIILNNETPGPVAANNDIVDFLFPKINIAPAMVFDSAANSQYIGLIAEAC